MQKVTVFSILLVTLFTYGNAREYNIQWGKRTDGDKIILVDFRSKSGKANKIVRGNFAYRLDTDIAMEIKYIEVEDMHTPGGGYAKFAFGYPKRKSVKINFRSQLGQGYLFKIVIYGR